MTDPVSTSNATPVSAPEGHDTTMAAKFDAAQGEQPTQQPNATERPAGLPEKFSSWEAMAEAYAELERKQSAPKMEVPSDPTQAQATVEAAGLDFSELTTEYNAGGLKDATYAKLEAAGIPRATVDAYIAGQEAIAQQGIDEVMGAFGGAENYGRMTQWAAANLSPSEIAAFDSMMDTGDLDTIKLVISGLQSKYTAANGQEPKLLNGGSSETPGDAFRSVAELTAAMGDPRYAKDAAYRADVEAKVARSNIF